MRKNILILFFSFFILVSLVQVSASFTLGNASSNNLYSLEKFYVASQPIKGWVNLSLNNEPNNSLLSALGKNITIRQFLDNNGMSGYYSCVPKDCGARYTSNNEEQSKSFQLAQMQSKLYGFRITGDPIDAMSGLEFTISTNAGESCTNPISIDVLDDGFIDFKAENVSNTSYCPMPKPYGCFDFDYIEGTIDLEENVYYCEKTTIPPVKGFRVGADLVGSTLGTQKSEFKLTLTIDGEEKSCTVYSNSSGEVSCVIIFDDILNGYKQAETCIYPQEFNGNQYKINFETREPCGYLEDNYGTHPKDFQIFVKPLKFASVSNFRFNQALISRRISDLGAVLTSYLDNKYSRNCTPECIIPIRFISGISQTTNINSINLSYRMGGSQYSANIYDINSTYPFLSTREFLKLDLEQANFLVPSTAGVANVYLNLGSTRVFNDNITVGNIPEIMNIVPNPAPSLVNVTLFAILKNTGGSYTYTWTFGNGTPVTTNNSFISHVFKNLDTVYLKLRVSSGQSEITKIFPIVVTTPKDAINKTIIKDLEKINTFTSALSNLSPSVKKEIDGNAKIVDTESLKSDLARLDVKNRDTSAGENDVRLGVMNELLAMKIPTKILVKKNIKNMPFVQNENRIDFTDLDYFGAGEASGNQEDVINSLNTWISDYLDMTFEGKSYSVGFDSGEETFAFSDLTFRLTPKKEIGDLYFVIEGDPSKVKIPDSGLKTKDSEDGNKVGIILNDIGTTGYTIEILYPDMVDISNLPAYISPDVGELGSSVKPPVCDNNKKCDKGEDYINCRNDCKPWNLAIWAWIILIIIGFGIYIGLQEWYKKYYEGSLFSNKTQLFNLINYMNTASNQGMTKSKIFDKLKEMSWKGEQLTYTWKKFKGERVGMFEIPIFKWFENKKVKEELKKRQGLKLNLDSFQSPR